MSAGQGSKGSPAAWPIVSYTDAQVAAFEAEAVRLFPVDRVKRAEWILFTWRSSPWSASDHELIVDVSRRLISTFEQAEWRAWCDLLEARDAVYNRGL